jgi:hypothetical protein
MVSLHAHLQEAVVIYTTEKTGLQPKCTIRFVTVYCVTLKMTVQEDVALLRPEIPSY